MGGYGSGQYPRKGLRPRMRRFTSELTRIRSYDAMTSKLESEGKATIFELYDSLQKEYVAFAKVSSREINLYHQDQSLFGKEKPIMTSPMIKQSCGPSKGYRFYFECPSCEKKCINLFWNGFRLACSKCHDLMHATQSASEIGRFTWKQNQFLERHKITASDLTEGNRPKNMRHSTFERLRSHWFKFESMWELVFLNRFTYPLALAAMQEQGFDGAATHKAYARLDALAWQQHDLESEMLKSSQ